MTYLSCLIVPWFPQLDQRQTIFQLHLFFPHLNGILLGGNFDCSMDEALFLVRLLFHCTIQQFIEMKYSRNRKQLEAWKREEGFDNRIIAAEKRQTYNALNDEHSGYYFVLPSVQEHLRRMRKAIRREVSSQADRLARSIDKKIESFDVPPRKKSRRKHDKQKLMAKNFIDDRDLAGRTELMRPQRNDSSNTHRQQVVKNMTEGRLPPLTKRTDKLDHSQTTDRTAHLGQSLKHKMERSDHNNMDISSHASIQHEKFQKFLDEKRQQVLKPPDSSKSQA